MNQNELTERQAGLSPAKRALLERLKRGAALQVPAPAAVPPLLRRAEHGPAPLSFSQQRLWFLDQLEPGNPAYNLRSLVRLSGALDRRALAAGLQEVARRQESLRTVFVREGAEPAQVVLPRMEIALPLIDLSGLPPERREAEWMERAGQEAGRRFELARGPLVRTLLGRLDADEHLLLLIQHHIVTDGWSMGVLLHELAAVYEAFAAGQAPVLAPLRLQYADFAAWQRRWQAGDALAADLAYWRRQLHAVPASLELPSDRPRPAVQSFRGASLPVALSNDDAAALRELARRQGATPFMAFLALFEVLLMRYNGQENLTVGTPVAGRSRKELEGLIGLFVNTLVLRGDLSGEPSFAELLRRVRHVALEAFQRQNVPLERLIEDLQPDRDLGRNPLFQVMFAFQNTPLPEIALSRLRLRQEELRSDTSMFDLTLSLRERDRVVAGFLEYSRDMFEEATAKRMIGHFGRLLAGAVEDPGQRVTDLPLLTEGERLQLRDWNARAMAFDLDACLHERFAAWAAKVPEIPAVVCGGRSLTYGELDFRANQLARRLRRLGVGPDVPVGLCVGRSVQMAVGLLGILKAGGAYLPLDVSYPRERLALMMADAGVPVLLTHGLEAGDLAGEGTEVIALDRNWEEIAREDGAPLDGGGVPDSCSPDNLAYIIYTSGSTGRPKGVACTHRGVINFMADLDRRRPLRPGEACGLWTSLSFDVAVCEIFTALCFGGSLHIPAEEERTSAETLFPWMARHRICGFHLPPFMLPDYEAWVRQGGEERRTLGRLLVGVEPIPERLLASLQAAVPGLRVINGYGPTEATICATFYDVPDSLTAERRTPLGLALANCRVYLLDDHLQEVPVGVPGEVWIGGVGLARGYFGRPDLTAERFMPDPVGGPGAEPGARCYRTGDLARRLPEGWVEFVGRRDQQVKVRGFRIELREVEAHLALCPGVRDAIVTVAEDPRGDKRLVAWVVPEGAADVAAWREDLRGRLPQFMIPSTFMVLSALPVTSTGKVDRGRLPEPDWGHVRMETEHIAPRTPAESLLAAIWGELLGREVGVADDFFAIGGHSLLATRVVARAREVFGVELPLRALFEARTLSALAAQVEALRGGAAKPESPIHPTRRTGPLPLSFSQQRLWFMDQLVPGGAVYNVPGAARLLGRLEPAVLAAVLAEVVRRHEVLRTTFQAVDGQPVQVIAAAAAVPLPVADLSRLPEAAREAEVARLAAAEARLPFDLARGPLLRFTLLRLGVEEHAALVTLHHIVSDAWSMGILFREVAALYEVVAQGKPSPLPELPVQYADFSVWQRAWLAGQGLEAELEYWRRQLAGAPALLELPTDRPRPAVQSYRGRSRRISLPARVVAPLESWGRRQGVTTFMILLGGLATVLGRYAGQRDVMIGSAIAGRDRRELEALIGFFVNALALRVDLSGDPGFDRLLGRVREMALDAYAHQSLPFERLVDEVAPVRDPSHSALFQVAFAFQNTPWEPLRLPGLSLDPLPVESGAAKVDLVLSLLEDGGGLAGVWDYAADLFDGTTIDRLAAHLETLLSAVAADAGTPLSELPLLTRAEHHQIVAEWNDTRLHGEEEALLDRLFAASAARWPDRTALVFEGRTLTYRELAACAGRLARRLRALGVGPEGLVGICAEEGIERIVAVVGVFLAGGAYVPLDPSHPAERLALMLDDSQVRVLLTQERLLGSLSAPGAEVVCLDGFLEAEESAELPPPSEAVPDNLAYVIYTSGSTGRPNGVQISHRSAVHLIRQAVRHGHVDAGSRIAQHVSFSFDASVLETWMALSAGATLCIAGRETRMSGLALAELLRRERATNLVVTPPVLATIPREGLPALRSILLGGDRCPADLATRWAVPGEMPEVLNCYGPTETTIYAGFLRIAGPYGRDPAIGRPVSDIRMLVVDPRGRLVPAGVAGELWIGGAGLARGYLNRPELTAQRFVPDPFSERPGERLYRTGDLVRFLPGGDIEFLGRIDRQVKLRGLRIELGEIEATLAAHAGIAECAVVVRGGTLAAYWVPRPGAAAETRELRAFLGERLPSYLVPGVFVRLEALPISPTGKVDRDALPAPPEVHSQAGAAAPRTAVEETLAGIWAQVLGLERVGIHDNFFELGGDSILGIQIVSRAQLTGLWLTARDLFQYQTVAELAQAAGREPGPSAATVTGGTVPLTPVQRHFFELDLADPHHFNQSLLLDLREPVGEDILERALGRLAAHHDALRLRFVRGEDGEWTQVAAAPSRAAFPLARIDLPELPPWRRKVALEAATSRLQESLDLENGPLARAAIFTLGEGKTGGRRLFLVLHHLVVDGVSWRILIGDLEIACRSLLSRGEAALPPVAMPFPRWAAELSEHARTPAASAELGYWLAAARTTVRPLPLDRPDAHARRGDTVASTESVVAELGAEETRALLQDVPAVYHSRINDALLTALLHAFAGWTGESRLLVDLEGHGRVEGADTSRTVGWLTAVYPVLLELSGRERDPGERLKAVKEQLRAVPRGGAGYCVLRHLGDEAASGRLRAMPAAEVVFNYLGQLDRGLPESSLFAAAPESGGEARSRRQRRGHLFEINGGVSDGCLRLTWTYSRALHDRATVEALVDRFLAALRALIDHCRSTESGGFTPSDFPEARVSQKDLDKLMARVGKRKTPVG